MAGHRWPDVTRKRAIPLGIPLVVVFWHGIEEAYDGGKREGISETGKLDRID